MSEPKPRKLVVFAAYGLMLLAVVMVLAAVESVSRAVLHSRGAATHPLFYRPPEGPREQVLADEPWFQLLDPQLSHAYSVEFLQERLPDFTVIPGFVAYGDISDRNALRVFALGGSTTDPNFVKSWPYFLQQELNKAGIKAVVFNGGVAGYSSNQELMKLIRDVFPLQPDVVVALNGVNDQGLAHSNKLHPMVHPYQTKVFSALTGGEPEPFRIFPNTVALARTFGKDAERKTTGVSFGPEVRTTPGRQWERNVRLMHSACDELGVGYLCFRQPVIGVGIYQPTPDELEMLDKYTRAVSPPGSDVTYVDLLKGFYAESDESLKRIPYCVDLVDVFIGKSGMYRDARHQTEAGCEVLGQAVFRELRDRGMLKRAVPAP